MLKSGQFWSQNQKKAKNTSLKSFEQQINNQQAGQKIFHISKYLHRYNPRKSVYYLQKAQSLTIEKPNKNVQISIPCWKSLRVHIKEIGYDNESQHIQCIYSSHESMKHIQKLSFYYKFYDQAPNIFHVKYFELMTYYVDHKNKLNYQNLQKQLALVDSQLNSGTNTMDQLLKQPESYDKVLLDLQSQRNTHKTTQSQSFYNLKNTLQEKFGISNEKKMNIVDQSYQFKKVYDKSHKKSLILKSKLEEELQKVRNQSQNQFLPQSGKNKVQNSENREKRLINYENMVKYQTKFQLNQNQEKGISRFKSGKISQSYHFLPKIKISIRSTLDNDTLIALKKSGSANKGQLKISSCIRNSQFKDCKSLSKCQKIIDSSNQRKVICLQKIQKQLKQNKRKQIYRALQAIKYKESPYCKNMARNEKKQRMKTSNNQAKQNQKIKKCSFNKLSHHQKHKSVLDKEIRHTLNEKKQ